MKEKLNKIRIAFDKQLTRVFKVIEFDREYLEIVLDQLKERKCDLVKAEINTSFHPTSEIVLLEALINSGPAQEKYQPIYNQCAVLLVSHFASVTSSLFNEALTYYLKNSDSLPEDIGKKEYKFSLAELNDLRYGLTDETGRMIARRSNVSFQDMKSISRAFEEFFNIKTPFDPDVCNIITSQCLRHAIVHNGEKIDEKCHEQLKHAKDRSIFLDASLHDAIKLQKDDLEDISNSMRIYVKNLSNSIHLALLN